MGEPFEGDLAFFTRCDVHRGGSHRRRRGEDLASLGERADPCGLVHTETRVVVGDGRGLGRVHADPDLRREAVTASVLGEPTLDRDRALQRSLRIGERREDAVAGRAHDLPAVGADHGAERLVVPTHDVLPCLITDGPVQNLLTGPVDYWVDELTRLAVEVGMDTFIYWPADDRLRQIELFAAEVVPAVQEQV